MYRSITLLNNLYNCSFASLIVPVFKTLMEICIVITAYGAIRLYDRLPVNVMILLPALAAFLFVEHQFAVDRMASVHEKSSQIRANYTNNYLALIEDSKGGNREGRAKHVKYMVAFLRSCRPLRCQLTHAIFVEKSTRLVLLDMLLDMLVTLLLSDNRSRQ